MMQQSWLQALFHAETYHIVQQDCEFSRMEQGSYDSDRHILPHGELERGLVQGPHLGLGPGCSVPLQGQQGYRGRIFATPWPAGCQAPLSMGFPRQEYWSGFSGHSSSGSLSSISFTSCDSPDSLSDF